MIPVNSKKAITKLSNGSFRMNNMRNIIAMIAIALTAILFTTLVTMGIGATESLQRATMRQAGGDGHAVLKYITDEQFNHFKTHPSIKEIAYNRILSNGVMNKEFLKRKAEFWYYDDVGLRLGFIELTHGRKPMKANEVMADSKTLQLLGVPLQTGSTLTLKLDIRGQQVTRDFVLSGWWDSDPVFNVGQIFASQAYIEAYQQELNSTYLQDRSLTGTISGYIMFQNSLNLQDKLNKVITDCGYSTDENSSLYIESNVNWSYLSTNFDGDPVTIIAILSALLLIVFSGYLIIYNIFQISVIKDIRYYGLLKTIGTTGKQIRRIIRRQAWKLSIVGIPLGLVIGFFVGKALVPLLINNTVYAGTSIKVSPSPWIFIVSALFALITVFMSTLKPGKIAATVSPIEAVNYSDYSYKSYSKSKKSAGGTKMHRMAWSNLGRNKVRTIIVVISLSLSLVLLNTVMTLSNSFDQQKFISKFNDTDFLIAHANYFQYKFMGTDSETSESFIQAVQKQPGFEEGGRLYGGKYGLFGVEDVKSTESEYKIENGHFIAPVYGLEDMPLKRLELIDGELDLDKLASGKYILEGIQLDDYNNPIMETAKYARGETVRLYVEGEKEKTYELIVLGHVRIKTFTNTDRTTWGHTTLYVPAKQYVTMVKQPAVMSYGFNVSSEYELDMESFLSSYTNTTEPVMNYDSSYTYKKTFTGLQNTIVMIGGALSFVLGLIGVLNFVNAIVTSILSRKKELAMLQSIGMSLKQLRSMLMYEGVYYVLATGLFSLTLGIGCSLLIVKPLSNIVWFANYHFMLSPILVMLPILLMLGMIIPWVAHKNLNKQSVVERLREA